MPCPSHIDFVGRAAVVTGGAQGIGRAVVEQLLGGGASVAIWDRDKALAERTASELSERGKVVAVGVDVGDYAAVERARDETVAALGKVDILVNSAGIAGPIAKTWEHTPDAVGPGDPRQPHRPFHCCKALVPGMIERNYGRIANIASIAGKEGNPNASAYSASKAGVIGLTKSLGKELADLRHLGQRHHPGGRQDRDPRHGHPGAYRLHAVEDPARPLRAGRGDRHYDRLHGVGGVLLHHRLHLRHFRRPGATY